MFGLGAWAYNKTRYKKIDRITLTAGSALAVKSMYPRRRVSRHFYNISPGQTINRIVKAISKRMTERDKETSYGVLVLNFVFLSVALLLLRLKSSMPCLGDFRYVYPMIISFIIITIYGIETMFRKKWIIPATAGFIISILFTAASGMFFG